MNSIHLLNYFKRKENPLIGLGYAYKLLAILDAVILPVDIFFYSFIISLLQKFIESEEVGYLAESIRIQGIMVFIGAVILLIINIVLAMNYGSAGKFINEEEMIWISWLNYLEALFVGLAIPFLLFGYLSLANNVMRGGMEAGGGSGALALASIFSLILGFLALIELIILLLLLLKINSEWWIEDSQSAILLLAISFIFTLVFPSGIGMHPYTVTINAIKDIIGTIINILFFITLYKVFKGMGEEIIRFNKDKSVLDGVIMELAKSKEEIKLSEIAKKNKVPLPLLKQEIGERILRGELRGNVINDTYYPPKNSG